MAEKFDNDASLRAAKEKLPLHRLMQQHGDEVSVGKKWGSCPFCKKKDTARVTSDGGQEFFKCANGTCPSGTSDKGEAWTEIHYLEFKTGLSGKEAFIAYLKEAGVYVEPIKKTSTPAPSGPAIDEVLVSKAIDLLKKEATTTIPFLQDNLNLGFHAAATLMTELESRKIVGPSKEAGQPRDVLIGPKPVEAKPELPAVKVPEPLDDDDILGRNVLDYFYSQLTPTNEQLVPYLPGGRKIPDPIPYDVAKGIKYKPVSLFEKRGIDSETCELLGFRSNPESNLKILLELEKKFGWEEIYATGLWQPPNKRENKVRRPNKQFYGLGQIGKKSPAERRNEDDKWVWGVIQPILIPYFDEAGRIIKLRPHKGGAPEGTLCGASRIYVPRAYKSCADTVEAFNTVIICEGEFKAVAIWQTQGGGRKDGKPPLGVCAIPGINFGKNDDLRMDLEAWLRSVRCRQVIVAFDDEDKSDKPKNVRFDALRWMRFLASDLVRKLYITAKVAVLPREWRDSKGKADWDGALARILKEEIGE